MIIFSVLMMLSGRAAFGAAYLRPHDPREFLVYAHSAEGNLRLAQQLQTLSLRLRGNFLLPIAYDNRDASATRHGMAGTTLKTIIRSLGGFG